MMNLKNFKLYIPDGGTSSSGVSALFLKSEDGKDWYDIQKYFQLDTLKVVYNYSGVIVAASVDASTLFPVDFSVVEMSFDNVPETDKLTGGGWIYTNGEIVPMIPLEKQVLAEAESKKKSLLSLATTTIATLQDAVDLDIVTEVEKHQLLAWKKYRVLLNRIDTSTVSDIEWPSAPKVTE